ncbi:MAG: saccharopine dehydrogenase [Flavobacteriales bacterium]|nr:saccharopine dehydrogenase [Flavobacteriales bacterium]|tara:strand:- start:21922 stop:23193 length:1272 start_codon:yes stop_codon:yes gene_type:complete
MKYILVIGSGRSSSVLIEYLINYSKKNDIFLTILDQYENKFLQQFSKFDNFKNLVHNINNNDFRRNEIERADLVISMLPPSFHTLIAKDCIDYKKNLITASYVSDEMKSLNSIAKEAGILILNEIGLDPGIDHISAMSIIDSLKKENKKITSFKSFCGGLIAPESCNNPWGYKFTWNPKNVVLAGKDGARYLKNGTIKKISYDEVFKTTESVFIPNFGNFESYPNRDSLHYKEKYKLDEVQTLVRGTLRKKDFASAWDFLVNIGFTSFDESREMITKDVYLDKLKMIKDKKILEMLNYLDFFDLKFKNSKSNGQILQNTLEKKWKLQTQDKDMIVMQHKFEFEKGNIKQRLYSSMAIIGSDSIRTAMAKTVGLPIFFAAKLILEGKVSLRGVRIPVHKELYMPILKSLEKEGIKFIESTEQIN